MIWVQGDNSSKRVFIHDVYRQPPSASHQLQLLAKHCLFLIRHSIRRPIAKCCLFVRHLLLSFSSPCFQFPPLFPSLSLFPSRFPIHAFSFHHFLSLPLSRFLSLCLTVYLSLSVRRWKMSNVNISIMTVLWSRPCSVINELIWWKSFPRFYGSLQAVSKWVHKPPTHPDGSIPSELLSYHIP